MSSLICGSQMGVTLEPGNHNSTTYFAMVIPSVCKILFTIKLWCCKIYKDVFAFNAEVDFYGKIKQFESICGFRAKCTTSAGYLLWVLYRLVFVAHFLEQSTKFVQSFLSRYDAETALTMQATHFAKMSNIVQLVVLGWFYEDICEIRTFVNTHRSCAAVYRKITWVTIRPLVCNSLIWAVFMLGGLNKLPVVLLDLGSNHPWLAGTVQFANDLYYFVLLMWFQLPNAIISSLFYGLTGELAVVAESFDNWLANVQLAVEDQLQDQCIFVTANYREYLFWQCCHQQLNDCARRLCEAIEHIGLLKRIMKPYLLVQYYALLTINTGLVCITMFGYIPTVPVVPIAFVVYLNVEFYRLCLLMEELSDALTTVGDRIYSQPWMDDLRYNGRLFRRQYYQVKRTVLIVLTICQRGVTFSCGGFFDMNVEMYAELLNLSYSMIMFAKSMR